MKVFLWILAPFIVLMIGIDEYVITGREIVIGMVWQIGYWVVAGGVIWGLRR